jgi:hypothetical protein
MIFAIVCCALMQIVPMPDTVLANTCSENELNPEVCAIFQTLNAAWQAEDNYQQNHSGNYLPLSIFGKSCLSPASFEKKLNCQLPLSAITDSSYNITVAKTTVEGDTCTETILIISFYNQNREHLPLAIFRYNMTQQYIFYEYITPDTSYALQWPPSN